MTQKTKAQLITEFSANLPDNGVGAITAAIFRSTMLDLLDSVATMLDPDQTLTGGANIAVFDNGTKSSGTFTVDCGKCPLQKAVNNGAFTLAAPSSPGSTILQVTNGASAGVITFSGFTVGAGTGDALDTTNGHVFSIVIWKVTAAGYNIIAHQ